MVNIREYQTGDATKIYSLFAKNTPYKRDAAFWVWVNRMLSDEKTIIIVAEEKNEIIGHYAILPRICNLNIEIGLKCGLGFHAFVDPNYREKVSIFSITNIAYKIALTKGYDFIYGFPNSNYRLIQEKIERWKKISLFNAYVKNLIKNKKLSLTFEWECIDEYNFETFLNIDELLENYYSPAKVYFEKSLPYFINRYIKHPQKLYQNWVLKNGGEVLGVIITKVYEGEKVRIHIIDLLLKNESHLSSLIQDFEVKFCKIANEAVLWPQNSVFEEILLSNGYMKTGFDTFFGIKLLSQKALNYQELILDFNNWDLCMGDSDAF